MLVAITIEVSLYTPTCTQPSAHFSLISIQTVLVLDFKGFILGIQNSKIKW